MSSTPSFRVLGPLEVTRDGSPLPLGGYKQRCVLAALLVHANEVVSTDRLVDAVWGHEAHEGAHNTLQVYIANLRKLLDQARRGGRGKGLIESVPPGYVLWVGEDELDLLAFEAASQRVESSAEAALRVLEPAVALWRGPLLSDLADESFVKVRSARLEVARQGMTADLITAKLKAGRHVEAVPELHSLVDAHPFDERLRGLLMIALYRAGRQADALGAYEQARRVLREQLGIRPGPELVALEQRVLDQDPELLASFPTDAGRTVSATGAAVPGTDDPAPATLVVDGETVELSSSVTTMGRNPDCRVVLRDRAASRLHAEIRRNAYIYTLVDRGSTNGTRVNGNVVADHVLASGDEIRVGGTAIVFRSADESASKPQEPDPV